MNLLEYLGRAASAWFMGFFPLFEIYLAVPAALAMNLDVVSAVFWSALGNFSVVPLVIAFHAQLTRVAYLRRFLEWRGSKRWQRAFTRYGALFILVMTPVLGVWAMTALARTAGIARSTLLLASLTSITLYAVVIAAGIGFGVSALDR